MRKTTLSLTWLCLCFAAPITQAQYSLGWQPDKGGVVDKAFGPKFLGTPIKDKVDLRPQMPPVYDQGPIGSCVGNGVAAVVDYAHWKGSQQPFWTPSRLFLYYQGRVAIGTVNQDSGCQIRDVVNATKKLGSPLESLWPYRVNKFTTRPPQTAYADGLKRQTLSAYKAETLEDVQRALSMDLPVVFGVPVYQAIQNVGYFSWRLPMPNAGERSIGGHCMTVVGYNTADKTLIVRNSWGKNWGRAGHMLMPFEYWIKFQRQTDAWVVSVTE